MEYISKESARKRAIEIPFNGKFHKVIPLGEIDTIPAADVRPVVRGEWELVDDVLWLCSKCHYAHGRSNFCPNCGADMRNADD